MYNIPEKNVTDKHADNSQRTIMTDEELSTLNINPEPSASQAQRVKSLVRPIQLLTHIDAEFIWDEECQQAFETQKDRLTSPLFLPNTL